MMPGSPVLQKGSVLCECPQEVSGQVSWPSPSKAIAPVGLPVWKAGDVRAVHPVDCSRFVRGYGHSFAADVDPSVWFLSELENPSNVVLGWSQPLLDWFEVVVSWALVDLVTAAELELAVPGLPLVSFLSNDLTLESYSLTDFPDRFADFRRWFVDPSVDPVWLRTLLGVLFPQSLLFSALRERVLADYKPVFGFGVWSLIVARCSGGRMVLVDPEPGVRLSAEDLGFCSKKLSVLGAVSHGGGANSVLCWVDVGYTDSRLAAKVPFGVSGLHTLSSGSEHFIKFTDLAFQTQVLGRSLDSILV